MSRISQDFINDLGFLYEHVHVKDQDFLNEESEYYDEEASELVEDILSTISLSMIYEGFSANAVIGFLADSTEEDILEKYLSYNDSIIFESVVDENYIKEQLEILDYLIIEGWREKVATAVGKFFAKRAPALSKGPGMLTQNAAYRLAMKGKPTLSTKARVGIERAIGPKGRKAVQAIKDFGGKVKEALPGIAKGALLTGTGVLAGYGGAKLASGGSGQQDTGKPTPSGTPSGTKGDDFLKGSALAKLGGREGRIKSGEFRTMKWSPESRARYDAATKGNAKPSPTPPATPAKPAKPAATPAKPAEKPAETPAKPDYETWAKKYPDLAAKVKPGQAGYDEISATRTKPGPNEKQDQTPTTGKPEAKIDTSSVEADIKKEQERLKKKAEQTAVTAKESYDAYDVILEYLVDTEQVDTLEEAHYVMMEMDSETVGNIVEIFVQRNL